MYKSIFTNLFAIVVVALLDAVFISSLPLGLHRLHLVFLVILFVNLMSNIRLAAWWALGGGLMLEVFSFGFFGTYLIISFAVLSVVFILFERVMTNRSAYSVMMVAGAATIVADVLFLIFDYWSARTIGTFTDLASDLLLSLAVNIVAALIFFYISNLASRRLKPVFLPFIRNW